MSTFSNYSISLDTKGPINPASDGNQKIRENVDPFSNYIVTVPGSKDIVQNALYAVFHQRISKFGPPQCLITDRRTEYLESEMANCCTLFKILKKLHMLFGWLDMLKYKMKQLQILPYEILSHTQPGVPLKFQ